MYWTDLHAKLLSQAFEQLLGQPDAGAMAFARCLTPDIVRTLVSDATFAPGSWHVWRVADVEYNGTRTITADRAVEMREDKSDAVLLLVDTARAGAGMDGIYSAARELDETLLFSKALPLAEREVTKSLTSADRQFAELAVRKARGFGRRLSVSSWTEFDFLCRIAASMRHPGEFLHLLGLWPVEGSDESNMTEALNTSVMFVDRLLGRTASGTSPARRIESLRLLQPSDQQRRDLEGFLRFSATRSLLPSLADLEDKKHLWINNLRIEGGGGVIQSLELVSWRTNAGRIAKWSGLTEEGDADTPPVLVLKSDANHTGDYSKLEVKWKARPEHLEKDAVEYRVSIVTDMDEELAVREVTHSAKKEEKCRFSNDDFSTLSEDALISARVTVRVLDNELVETQESEEFLIRFGQPAERSTGGVGKKVRTFSDGLIELDERDMVLSLANGVSCHPDSKGFVVLRTPKPGKSFRVFRPALIREVDRKWVEEGGAIGRWSVKVRSSGARAGEINFIPMSRPDSSDASQSVFDRAAAASRRIADRFGASAGSVGQIYDERSPSFKDVKEYLLSWATLLEIGDPVFALANTVEVQSLSGRTIGLIVLPSHPSRVAWLAAYDNLVFHTAFDQELKRRYR